MNEIARSVRRSVLVLSTLTGSSLPLPAGAAATFQVAVLTSADTLGCYDDSDFPPESDAGAVPIGPPPGSSSGSQSAAAAAGLASGQGFASGQALLTAPGSLAGAVLRAEATMQAVAPAGGVCAPQANGGARSRVAYADVLDVSGPSPATPVTLRVSLELDGAMQRAGLSAANHVQPSFGDTGTPAQPIEQLLCTNRNGPCAETDTGERVVLTGIPHPISLELFTQVNVAPSIIGDLFANSSSEFSSTLPAHRGRLCIDLLTPGSDLYTGEWRRPALRVRPVRRPGAASSGTRSAAARARGDGPPRATAARLRRVAAAEGRSRANDLS